MPKKKDTYKKDKYAARNLTLKYPHFLIVGMGRSGSLWTSAMLNAHRDIASFPFLPFYTTSGEKRVGEVHFFNTLASLEPGTEGRFTRPISGYLTMYGGVFADLVPHEKKVSKEKFYAMLAKRYSEHCNSQRGKKKIVGELTSEYLFHLNFVDSFYPNIKKICIIRDPKDKTVSWHFRTIATGKKNEEKLTREFAIDYLNKRIIKEYEALLNYDGSVHCITYEKLREDTPKYIKGAVQYLGMPVSDTIISRMIEEGSFESMTARDTKAKGRKRGEEDSTAQIRKGVIGDWKNHLSADVAQEIDNATRDLRHRVFKKYNVDYASL